MSATQLLRPTAPTPPPSGNSHRRSVLIAVIAAVAMLTAVAGFAAGAADRSEPRDTGASVAAQPPKDLSAAVPPPNRAQLLVGPDRPPLPQEPGGPFGPGSQLAATRSR